MLPKVRLKFERTGNTSLIASQHINLTVPYLLLSAFVMCLLNLVCFIKESFITEGKNDHKKYVNNFFDYDVICM